MYGFLSQNQIHLDKTLNTSARTHIQTSAHLDPRIRITLSLDQV